MKVLEALKKYFKYYNLFEDSHQPKTRTMQKPANLPAMQINWLVPTKREPKTTGDLEQTRVPYILPIS